MTRSDRTIVNIDETPFDPYDMEGPVQDDMKVLKLLKMVLIGVNQISPLNFLTLTFSVLMLKMKDIIP